MAPLIALYAIRNGAAWLGLLDAITINRSDHRGNNRRMVI
jgi:hypothetical protein